MNIEHIKTLRMEGRELEAVTAELDALAELLRNVCAWREEDGYGRCDALDVLEQMEALR